MYPRNFFLYCNYNIFAKLLSMWHTNRAKTQAALFSLKTRALNRYPTPFLSTNKTLKTSTSVKAAKFCPLYQHHKRKSPDKRQKMIDPPSFPISFWSIHRRGLPVAYHKPQRPSPRPRRSVCSEPHTGIVRLWKEWQVMSVFCGRNCEEQGKYWFLDPDSGQQTS